MCNSVDSRTVSKDYYGGGYHKGLMLWNSLLWWRRRHCGKVIKYLRSDDRSWNQDYVALCMVLCLLCFGAVEGEINEFDRNGAGSATLIWAAPGGEASLPCDLTPPSDDDQVSMVLWFKDSAGMPLYSVDFRSGPLVHWAMTDELGRRSHFVLEGGSPDSARLVISEAARDDEGIYRCRIDFVNSPTKNRRVNLTVIVPPEEPRIFDAEGREVGHVAGPFREGYDLFLSCQVTGGKQIRVTGKPTPEVTWWHGDYPLDPLLDSNTPSNVVVSRLFISTVTRDLSGARLQCRARSTGLMKELIKEVGLNIYLKPTSVELRRPMSAVSVGRVASFRCAVAGSRPPPKIAWFLDGQRLDNANTMVNTTGNVTVSVLTWPTSRADDGRRLACRGANSWFPADTKQDSFIINVAFPPIVNLTVGSNEDPEMLEEDADVQLICHSEAKPPVENHTWYKGDRELAHDPGGGFLVLGRTLRILNLSREDSGEYTCVASNARGQTRSNTLLINVLYRPICARGVVATRARGVRGEALRARCEVESPERAGVPKFYWTYTDGRNVLPVKDTALCTVSTDVKSECCPLNTRGKPRITAGLENLILVLQNLAPKHLNCLLPQRNISTLGTLSTALHAPVAENDEDLGTLACWAANAVGNQKNPCLFHIVPADIPQAPINCKIGNVGPQLGLVVSCEEGFDGGVQQHFMLEVVESQPRSTLRPAEDNVESNEISTLNDQAPWSASVQSEPVFRLSGKQPHFRLQGLRPGHAYQLLVYAVNARGRSHPPALLDDVTVPNSAAVEGADPFHDSGSSSILGGMVGGSGSVAMLAGALAALAAVLLAAAGGAALVLACRRRRRRSTDRYDGIERRDRSGAPSMYGDGGDGFGLHFGVPTVVIRPGGGARRTSRLLSARLSGILEDEVHAQGLDLAVLGIPETEIPSENSSEARIEESEEIQIAPTRP